MPLTSSVLAASPFDLIGGLPVHPLVVHFAVVLLPLSALALILLVFVPRWRGAFGWVTLVGLAVGTVAAWVAKESGEQLAARVGNPQEHAELGDILPFVAGVLFVLAAAWFLLDRRARRTGSAASGAVTAIGIVAAIVAVAAIILTIVVGHSGAEAAWSGRVAPAASAPVTTPGAGSGLTMADVASHATPADCWTAVKGNVYNVTGWISQHPGGAAVIEGMCGVDATASFEGQHQGQARPQGELDRFLIGPLASAN